MAKCPHCKADIEFLEVIVNERNVYRYSYGGLYESYDGIHFDVDVYQCPECHKEIKVEDADEFLKP